MSEFYINHFPSSSEPKTYITNSMAKTVQLTGLDADKVYVIKLYLVAYASDGRVRYQSKAKIVESPKVVGTGKHCNFQVHDIMYPLLNVLLLLIVCCYLEVKFGLCVSNFIHIVKAFLMIFFFFFFLFLVDFIFSSIPSILM